MRLLALIALVAACGSKGAYPCSTDSQCVRGGDRGICSTGFCAFADPACEGGYRFEASAGDGLANTCTMSTVDAGIDASTEPGATCIADVAFGRRFGCVLKDAGTVWCSGENASGQLGFGLAGVSTATPMQVRDVTTALVTDATAIGLGRTHACAVRAGGTVWCWGSNPAGELGNGTNSQSAAAVQVIETDGMPLTGAAEVKAGYNHSCARTTSGEIHCWGGNGEAQLGDGTTMSRSRAAPVLLAVGGAPLAGAVELHVGGGHGCIRKANDEMWCWGKNNDGGVGDGTNVHKPLPVMVGSAKAIATSLWSTCRVNADTSISCHGWNRGAAFGLGGEEGFQQGPNYLSPTKVDITGATKLAMGSGLCAIMSDTSVRCSGDGQYGQNGTGAPRRVLTPVKLASGAPLTGADRIVAKWPHVCAHLTSGSWVCWGRNTHGDFGDGTFDSRGFAAALKASCP